MTWGIIWGTKYESSDARIESACSTPDKHGSLDLVQILRGIFLTLPQYLIYLIVSPHHEFSQWRLLN